MTAQKKMSKTQLMTELARAMGTNKKTAAAFVGALSNIAHREAKKAGEFTIPGVGKLVQDKLVKREIRIVNSNLNPGRDAAIGTQIVSIPFEREIKDSAMRGKFSKSKIRAAVQTVARRHGAI